MLFFFAAPEKKKEKKKRFTKQKELKKKAHQTHVRDRRLMKLDLNDLVEHVEKNSHRVTPLEYQIVGGRLVAGFATGGTAFERDVVDDDDDDRREKGNSTHRVEPSIGRIDSALNGNEESWHLLTNRAEKGDLRAEYVVSYVRVAVRMQPHIDSSLLGMKRKGEVVVAVSKHGEWLEILDTEEEEEEEEVKIKKKGENRNAIKTLGWMLTTHPEFGDLLKFSRGSQMLPAVNQVLASKEANEKVDHENMVTIDYRQPRTFRVVSKSWVPVRIKPKLDAHAIGGKQCDEIIRVDAKRGDWVKLSSKDFPAGYFKWREAKAELPAEKKEDEESKKEVESKKVEEQEDNKECWMLTVHPEKGLLLQECRADGSDLLISTAQKAREQQQQRHHHQQQREREIELIPRCANVYTASDVTDKAT